MLSLPSRGAAFLRDSRGKFPVLASAQFCLCYNLRTVMQSNSALFPRNFRKAYPIAVRGEGCSIIDQTGRRFLDASGQAAVVNIGHGVAEIGRAMAEQSSKLAFAHTTQFHSEP